MNLDKLEISVVEYWVTDKHGRMTEKFYRKSEADAVNSYPVIRFITLNDGTFARSQA